MDPGQRKGKRGAAAGAATASPAPADGAGGAPAQPQPSQKDDEVEVLSDGDDGGAPEGDDAAAAALADDVDWEPLEREALGVPVDYVARQPGTAGVTWRQEHLSGAEPALHAPSMAADDLRAQVARRLSGLDSTGAPAYPKEMQQLKLMHTLGVLSRVLLDFLECTYEISPRRLAVNDAGLYTGGFVDDPESVVTTLGVDDIPPQEYRVDGYSYDALHYQTVCTRDAMPTPRRLVDLIGTLETTFLQRYAPGQDLAKWNRRQDALLRRAGAAGAAPASAAEAFVAGIDDSELQRDLHISRLAPAPAAAPPVTPPLPGAPASAAGRARRGRGRGGGGAAGGRGAQNAAVASA